MVITEKIKEIEKSQKPSARGQDYWIVTTASGQKVYCWDWSKIADVRVGMEAELTIEKNRGGYATLVAALPVIRTDADMGDAPFGAPGGDTPVGYGGASGRNESIRQAALGHAIQALGGKAFDVDGILQTDEIIAVATVFETYIKTGVS